MQALQHTYKIVNR